MMQNLPRILILLSLPLLMATCSAPRKPPASGRLQIFVSIAPQKYFVEQIGGEYVSVTTLIPSGASPHTFEPKPAQMVLLTAADCYFTIGIELEKAWLLRLGTGGTHCLVVATDSGIPKMMMDDSEEEHEHALPDEPEHHHHPDAADPHIWLAPSLVKLQTATITGALCRLDSTHASYFRKRRMLFDARIDSLCIRIAGIIDSCATRREFLVFHPSWGYFAREFSLRQIAIEVEGKEPTLRQMKMILDTAKSHHITTIFIQPQFSRKIAESIAQQLDAKVAVADPMAEAWGDNLMTFTEALCR